MARSAWQIVRHGYEPLKQAIAGGQYDYPKGLFWGGNRLEEGSEKLIKVLPGLLDGVQDILWIDVHSGLGAYGELTYLLEASTESALHQRLSAQFGARFRRGINKVGSPTPYVVASLQRLRNCLATDSPC